MYDFWVKTYYKFLHVIHKPSCYLATAMGLMVGLRKWGTANGRILNACLLVEPLLSSLAAQKKISKFFSSLYLWLAVSFTIGAKKCPWGAGSETPCWTVGGPLFGWIVWLGFFVCIFSKNLKKLQNISTLILDLNPIFCWTKAEKDEYLMCKYAVKNVSYNIDLTSYQNHL